MDFCLPHYVVRIPGKCGKKGIDDQIGTLVCPNNLNGKFSEEDEKCINKMKEDKGSDGDNILLSPTKAYVPAKPGVEEGISVHDQSSLGAWQHIRCP